MRLPSWAARLKEQASQRQRREKQKEQEQQNPKEGEGQPTSSGQEAKSGTVAPEASDPAALAADASGPADAGAEVKAGSHVLTDETVGKHFQNQQAEVLTVSKKTALVRMLTGGKVDSEKRFNLSALSLVTATQTSAAATLPEAVASVTEKAQEDDEDARCAAMLMESEDEESASF